MRKSLSSVLLGLSLVSPACKSKRESPRIDLASNESAIMRATADDSPPPEDTAEPGGDTTAMALDEGKMGKGQHDGSTRAQAVEAARNTGILGSTNLMGPGATGRGYGTLGGGRMNSLGASSATRTATSRMTTSATTRSTPARSAPAIKSPRSTSSS